MNWKEKLVECHPHEEDTDDYPFSMSRLVALIHEARREACVEAVEAALGVVKHSHECLHDPKYSDVGCVCGASQLKTEIAGAAYALAAKEGET